MIPQTGTPAVSFAGLGEIVAPPNGPNTLVHRAPAPNAQHQALFEQGNALSEAGDYRGALKLYSQILRDDEAYPAVWVNCGNALQKQTAPGAVPAAVRAYDHAIGLLRELPFRAHPPFRNCLGSAWLNRGHALLQTGDLPAAIRSFEEAVALLQDLPVADIPAYRLNLAGARLNLANVLLTLPVATEPVAHALDAARSALELVRGREEGAAEFADAGLKARRVVCDAIGRWLELRPADAGRFLEEAGDAVDDGLTLVRRWEARGVTHFRPLAARLLRFGAQYYRLARPQFLAEFLLENLDPARSAGALPAGGEFGMIADEALAAAHREIRRQPVPPDEPALARMLQISRELADARERVARLRDAAGPDSGAGPLRAGSAPFCTALP